MPPLPAPDRQRIGAAAEDAALAFLTGEGLRLLARNVRYPFGEIDLVMREAATVVFVEVRFRRNDRFGGAAVSVDAAKRRKVARASQAWLGSHRQYAQASCRFDVIAVTPAGAAPAAAAPSAIAAAPAAPTAVRPALACDWIRTAFTLDDLW